MVYNKLEFEIVIIFNLSLFLIFRPCLVFNTVLAQFHYCLASVSSNLKSTIVVYKQIIYSVFISSKREKQSLSVNLSQTISYSNPICVLNEPSRYFQVRREKDKLAPAQVVANPCQGPNKRTTAKVAGNVLPQEGSQNYRLYKKEGLRQIYDMPPMCLFGLLESLVGESFFAKIDTLKDKRFG